jgi:hypothetical protein
MEILNMEHKQAITLVLGYIHASVECTVETEQD